MKYCGILALFLFSVMTVAQAQNNEPPLYYENIQTLPWGKLFKKESQDWQYQASLGPVQKRDGVQYVFDHNKITPGKLHFLFPFPIMAYRTPDAKVEILGGMTAAKGAVLVRFWF